MWQGFRDTTVAATLKIPSSPPRWGHSFPLAAPSLPSVPLCLLGELRVPTITFIPSPTHFPTRGEVMAAPATNPPAAAAVPADAVSPEVTPPVTTPSPPDRASSPGNTLASVGTAAAFTATSAASAATPSIRRRGRPSNARKRRRSASPPPPTGSAVAPPPPAAPFVARGGIGSISGGGVGGSSGGGGGGGFGGALTATSRRGPAVATGSAGVLASLQGTFSAAAGSPVGAAGGGAAASAGGTAATAPRVRSPPPPPVGGSGGGSGGKVAANAALDAAAAAEAALPSRGPGALRPLTHIRVSSRFDFQPDVCKDYRETGFCGFGDACKFLHDRSDATLGWKVQAEWARRRPGAASAGGVGGGKGGAAVTADDAAVAGGGDDRVEVDASGLPFACFVCRRAWTPTGAVVVTPCGHYFCEACGLSMGRRCAVCGLDTGGTLNAGVQVMEHVRAVASAAAAGGGGPGGAPGVAGEKGR